MIRTYSNLDSTTEEYITEVIDCGFAVHKDVGPGTWSPFTAMPYAWSCAREAFHSSVKRSSR